MNKYTALRVLAIISLICAITGSIATRSDAAGVGEDFTVQLNAGPKTWKIRKQAKVVDQLVDGLTIRTKGDCSTADLCVDVKVDHYDDAEMLELSYGHHPIWLGLCAYPSPTHYVVYLNTKYTFNRQEREAVSLHELGHALGLDHNEGEGVMGESDIRPDFFTPGELALIQAKYAQYI